MGVFRQFPYSNFHEMNMDDIIKIVKTMLEEWAQYHAEWDAWMTEINDDWSNYQEVMNEAWENMQDFINNYFDNLDVQNEINNKIISMVNSGEFATIVSPYVPPQVTAWLSEHITEPVGVVIDTSLSVSGACADAKVTGDYIFALQDDVIELENLFIFPYNRFAHPTSSVDGKLTDPTGSTADNALWGYVNIDNLTEGWKLSISGGRHITCFYEGLAPSEGHVISGGSDTTANEIITVPVGATGVRVSFLLANRSNMCVVKSDIIFTIDNINAGLTYPSELLNVPTKNDINDIDIDLHNLYTVFNIFNYTSVVDGKFTSPEGSTADNASWDYINFSVEPSETYSITGGRFMICFYTDNHYSSVVPGGADYSSGKALITVPNTAYVMRVSSLVANKNVMQVVKSDHIIEEYLPYTTVVPSNNFGVYNKVEINSMIDGKINVVTIGTDYADLRVALEDIATKSLSFNNRYIIKLPKGTYNIRNLFTNEELATTKGLFVPPFTKIIGMGNPSEVVLTWINTENNSTQAVLNIDCTAELENLTLYGEKLRYALHDDWTVRKWDGVTPYSEYWYDAFINRNWYRKIKNCIIEVVDSPVGPSWGAGLVNGTRWIFENCSFISNKAYAISCHNNTGFNLGADIKFVSCKFDSPSALTRFGRLTTISNSANGIINNAKFIGCKDVNASKLYLLEEDAENFGTGCLWSVNGYSDTFDNNDVIIVVTDGIDYSSRIDII